MKSMDLELGAFQFGNLGLNTKLAGKEKKSGPISQLLAYLLNLVCAGAKCSNPTSPETWAFVSFGDSPFVTNRYLLPGLQNFRKVLGSTLTIRPQNTRICAE